MALFADSFYDDMGNFLKLSPGFYSQKNEVYQKWVKQGYDEISDKAMLDSTNDYFRAGAKGGIDFKSDKMNVQTQVDTGKIKFNVDRGMLGQLQKTSGFMPVIIDMRPMMDLRGFLRGEGY